MADDRVEHVTRAHVLRDGLGERRGFVRHARKLAT
jgi:hypothetical protein